MGKFGFTNWSWKRALGISKLKQKIARATGIPTTKGGRQRKVGRMLGNFGLPLLGGQSKREPIDVLPEPDIQPEQAFVHTIKAPTRKPAKLKATISGMLASMAMIFGLIVGMFFAFILVVGSLIEWADSKVNPEFHQKTTATQNTRISK